MNTISAKLTQIKVNGENPRSITNDKLNKLVNSILVFPKMLSIRPIVVDDKMVALGGNMRLNALKIIAKMSPEELGTRLATIPDYLKKSAGERENIARHWEAWLSSPVVEIIKASELTADERKQFIIKDNVSFGTWDYDALANGWDESSLGDWGMDVWQMQPTSFSQPAATAPATYPSAPAPSEVDGEVVFESALPAELQGVDLTPAELPKIQGDDQTAVERVIIVFPKDKEPFMRNMKAKCDELGMRFYVSDAHFKELCCNGSCCGLPADWNYSKGQWCEALQIAKNNPEGIVTWNDVKGDINMLVSQFEWRQASGYNCNSSEKRAKFEGMTMADYMRWLWNNPQNGQSPYKLFEGALVPIDKDLEGNLIYKFNGARF